MTLEDDLTSASADARIKSGFLKNPVGETLLISEKSKLATIYSGSQKTIWDRCKEAVNLISLAPRSLLHLRNLLTENHSRASETAQLKIELDRQSQEISDLRAAVARGSQKHSVHDSVSSASDLSPLWDRYYRAFEDRFRGSEELIKGKQSNYISEIHPWLPKSALAVDIGCGRGEWLKLLKTEGVDILGIDMNAAMIQEATNSGITVHNIDALSWLANQPSESVDLITAFHVVEHLTPNDLLQMLAEIARVLKKNGIVLLETPNPENIIVGACNFWTDITHKKPIPPATLGFILDFLGFEQVKCIRSGSPFDGADPKNPLEAPQDYAIISKKR